MENQNPADDVPLDELRALRRLSLGVDELLEVSLKRRETLQQTLARCLPRVLELCEAKAITLRTQDEELRTRTWSRGELGTADELGLLSGLPGVRGWGVSRQGEDTLVAQPLDVAGTEVGAVGMLFEGDQTGPCEALRVRRRVHAFAEQLDTVLISLHTAAEKHHLILDVNTLLADPVFETGMDRAVEALAQRVPLPGMAVVFRDAVKADHLHYRLYENGQLKAASGVRPDAMLAQAVAQSGLQLIAAHDDTLRRAVAPDRATEAVLISGARTAPMGKIVVWSGPEGFSTYTLDLIRVLASTLAQRLVDYNRERIHLSQFFSASVIDALLKDPDYETRYLGPRDEAVGILFADINSFTRLCERGLESPSEIGHFVDRWSAGVVALLWKHGGVFDKMVGDCVIGLFGPPFFQGSALERMEASVRAALDIRAFTKSFETPEVRRMCEAIQLPGLGVAIGVNYAQTFCGLFGPNRQYTGFSTGMNQTARLQSLGGFREILLMLPVRDALAQSEDAGLRALVFGPLTETPVKNVAQPLRHVRIDAENGDATARAPMVG